jgi:hypothetical protein
MSKALREGDVEGSGEGNGEGAVEGNGEGNGDGSGEGSGEGNGEGDVEGSVDAKARFCGGDPELRNASVLRHLRKLRHDENWRLWLHWLGRDVPKKIAEAGEDWPCRYCAHDRRKSLANDGKWRFWTKFF